MDESHASKNWEFRKLSGSAIVHLNLEYLASTTGEHHKSAAHNLWVITNKTDFWSQAISMSVTEVGGTHLFYLDLKRFRYDSNHIKKCRLVRFIDSFICSNINGFQSVIIVIVHRKSHWKKRRHDPDSFQWNYFLAFTSVDASDSIDDDHDSFWSLLRYNEKMHSSYQMHLWTGNNSINYRWYIFKSKTLKCSNKIKMYRTLTRWRNHLSHFLFSTVKV